MEHARIALDARGDPNVAETLRVCLSVVAQRIAFRGDDEGRRHPVEVRAQHRRVRIVPVGFVAHVVRAEPFHVSARETVPFRELLHRPRGRAKLRHGNAQELEDDLRSAALASDDYTGRSPLMPSGAPGPGMALAGTLATASGAAASGVGAPRASTGVISARAVARAN